MKNIRYVLGIIIVFIGIGATVNIVPPRIASPVNLTLLGIWSLLNAKNCAENGKDGEKMTNLLMALVFFAIVGYLVMR